MDWIISPLSSGGAGTSSRPMAPAISVDTIDGSFVTFAFDVPETATAGDTLVRQVRIAGGNWSSLIDNASHVLSPGEDAANRVTGPSLQLANNNYEARGFLTSATTGLPSGASNTLPFSIAVTAAPSIVTAPTVSGNNSAPGNVLSVTNGLWNGTYPFTFAYQWKKGGVNISGATSGTYAMVSGDAGSSITCSVTATNTQGNTSQISNTFIVGSVPANTVAPSISGAASVGSTLTVANGTWTGPPSSYTYQWKLNGTNIGGATAATYVVQSGDLGGTLTCAVTGVNGWGSATALSSSVTVNSPAVAAFLARTSGLDATHQSLYTNLINNLVSGGGNGNIFALLDSLWIRGTQDVANSRLNLVSSSFANVDTSATFTADQGITGNGTSGKSDTQLVVGTGTQASLNSTSVGVAVRGGRTSNADSDIIGACTSFSSNNMLFIQPLSLADAGKISIAVNGSFASRLTVTNPGGSATGIYGAVRDSATTIKGYRNGSSTPIISGASNSQGTPPNSLYLLALHNNNGSNFATDQVSAAYVGAAMTGAQIAYLHDQINTFLAGLPTPANIY